MNASQIMSSGSAVATLGSKRNHFQGPCYCKLLVNNLVAGSVIGKNGSVIGQIEQETGCVLKLSPTNSFYPGTQERIVVISGQQEQVNNALLVVLEKIRDISHQHLLPNGLAATPSAKYTAKMMVPKSSVSAIIGKGGGQIRELQETTGAKIQISSREDGLDERIVALTGTHECLPNAALAICASLQTDPNLKDHMYLDYSKVISASTFGAAPAAVMGGGLTGFGGTQYLAQYGAASAFHPQAHPQGPPQPPFGAGAIAAVATGGAGAHHGVGNDMLSQHCEIVMHIPDKFVGPVIGKNGMCLTEIIHSSGARVQISQKGDIIPGTNDRKCVISGSVGCVHMAHIMMLQRRMTVEYQLKQSSNSATSSASAPVASGNTNGQNSAPTAATGAIANHHVNQLMAQQTAAPQGELLWE